MISNKIEDSFETHVDHNMLHLTPINLPSNYLNPQEVACKPYYREIMLPKHSNLSSSDSLLSICITFLKYTQPTNKWFWVLLKSSDLKDTNKNSCFELEAALPYRFNGSTSKNMSFKESLEACFEELEAQQNKYASLPTATNESKTGIATTEPNNSMSIEMLTKKYPGAKWQHLLILSGVGTLGIGSCLEDSKGSLVLIPDTNCNSKILIDDILKFIELCTPADSNMDEIILQIPILRMNKVINLLQKHPLVKTASLYLVDERIRAELTLNEALEPVTSQNEEYVDLWESHFQLSYRDIKNPFVGWYSSFTRQPIPVPQMEEWVNNIVAAIDVFKPECVLEIGCGSGLILSKLAPKCSFYHGTDLSDHAVQYLNETTSGWPGLELSQREAGAGIRADEQGKYDTVVMNSVTQYFPDLNYMDRVLEGALKACRPGGRVFIGDVRDLEHLENFHSEVELSHALNTLNISEFRDNVRQRVAKDLELLLNRQYFEEFAKRHRNSVSHVTFQLHRGQAQIEMIKYRYNVVIHLKEENGVSSVRPFEFKWNKANCQNKNDIKTLLASTEHEAYVVTGIPNSRIALGALGQKRSTEWKDVQDIREHYVHKIETQNPEEVALHGESLGFKVRLLPSNQCPSLFDILFFKGDENAAYILENSGNNSASVLSTNPTVVKERYAALTKIKLHLKAHLKDGNLPSIDIVNEVPEPNNNVSTDFNDLNASIHPTTGYTLLSKFEIQAQLSPNSICMTHQERNVSFEEMNQKAERLCILIQAFSKSSEEFVALLLPPSIEFILGSIGIFKSGKATVPLSTDYALHQLELMLDDCNEPLLISTHSAISRIGLKYNRILYIDDINWNGIDLEDFPKTNRKFVTPTPRDLSHCIFTSGTTGKPKAVLLEHGAVLNFIEWTIETMKITDKDSTIFVTNPAFDGSFIELWPFLSTGAVIHVIPNESYRYDAEERARFLEQRRITIYNAATPLVEKVLEHKGIIEKCENLRWIICGGDKFRKFPVNEKQQFGIILCYGTTEAACTSTALHLKPCHEGVLSVGKAISNVQVHVLDDGLRPVAPGVVGEVYIGGAGVAKGYLKEPGLTRQKFIRDTFSSTPGAKLYKTGDLGYLLPDSSLVLQGRADDMVKVRGLRIALGEIEQALMIYPGFKRVVVLLYEKNEEQVLVAFCTSDSLESKWPTVEEMRKFLKPYLPPYAMPSAFIQIPEFPVNRNGKIDMEQLRRIYENNRIIFQNKDEETEDFDQNQKSQPQYKEGESIEDLIMKLWATACKIDPEDVSVSSNFFELGGSSLLMAKVTRELQNAIGVEIPFNYMIDYSTVESLAYHINKILLN